MQIKQSKIMRKLSSLLSIIIFLLFITISCSKKDDPIIDDNDPIIEDNDIINDNKYVNDWIYEEMNIYYLWNDKIPKNPDFTLSPDKFFKSILYKYDKSTNPQGDRFSWIQEDYADLLGFLSGVSSDEIGFDYEPVGVRDDPNKLYAFVKYPKLGSDAFAKGIKRGRVVVAVDGKEITQNNYRSVFTGNGTKILTMADFVYNTNKKAYELKLSGDVSIQMDKNFAEIPVHMDSVYTIGDKKIGYIVYNLFATGRTNRTNEYDELLMNTLASIKAKGATEMVLDLRYNGGGAVTTALALASALVKNRSTRNILVTAEYNDIVSAAFKKKYGANYNKDYFLDKVEGTNIEIPKLNLSRLYVLVTGGSASASELIINGLRPYMEVILIGETTYGKNVGSISIFEENDPKNKWGMQPIIVKYSNSRGESDFTAGFKPDFEVNEFDFIPFREFGNTEDPLLRIALNQITGNAMQTRSMFTNKEIATNPEMIQVELPYSSFNEKARFEMYDDVRGEEIKKLMKE